MTDKPQSSTINISSETGVSHRSTDASRLSMVLRPTSAPLVSFRILHNIGAASDPAGKEGLASLTASMLSNGGSSTMSYDEIVQSMYPIATELRSQVDKEMTVFYGTTHVDNLGIYYRLISEMLLNPGWREDDFARLKQDAINFLKVNLRGNNDEELAKEALYNFIYTGHPYGHHSAGKIGSLEKLSIEDLKGFYREKYTRPNLVIGLSGGFKSDFALKVEADFRAKLPPGEVAELHLPEPARIDGLEVEIIEKSTLGTAISLGFPLSINRSSADWPALLVAQSFFGQHRSSNSYLYQRLRQMRGLNYGDYAYIEYFPRGMFQIHPDPNLGRKQQIFQIWIRPVEPKNGLFALRLALYELRNFAEKGISRSDFEETRQFLSKFVNILTKSQDAELGYALDSRYYGIPDFNVYVRSALARLTLEDVNRVIRKHLQADNVKIVVVTADAEAFQRELLADEPSGVSYATPPAPRVLDEDAVIERRKLDVRSRAVKLLAVDELFES
jgi:zinc protease